MNPIPASMIPPRPGLEKEEPELAHEDDIPDDQERSDDGTDPESSREIERE